MTVIEYRNENGDYEFVGYDPVPGYSRVAAMKAKPALTTWKLKRAVACTQYAALTGATDWLHSDPYQVIRDIDGADTEKADAGTCVARACELLINDGLAPADAATQAISEQQQRIATWNEWSEATSYQRRKQKLRKPPQINFVPDHDHVVASLQGFINTCADIGFTAVHTEQTVFTPGVFAGTADIFGTFNDGGTLECWDIKTGANVYPDMNLQLAAYANAELWVTGNSINPELNPAPANIDRTTGGIFHVTAHGCDAYPMNLDGAWEAFTGLVAVTRHEQLCKHTTLDPIRVVPPRDDLDETDDQRTVWCQQQTKRIAGTAAGLKMLKDRWPADTPFQPPWTPEQISAVTAVVSQVGHRLDADDPVHPFGPPDPNLIPEPRPTAEPAAPADADIYPTVNDPTAEPADPDAVAALGRRNETMHPDEAGCVQRWLNEAKQAGRPFNLGSPDTADTRRFEIARAAISLATNVVRYPDNILPDLDEQIARQIIVHATGWDITDLHTTGGLLGALDATQADTVEQIAHRYPTHGLPDAK